jgi:cellulose synthase/poly-beta-1,6-N-acetylglucosamine synthase-like glycosyltransferase
MNRHIDELIERIKTLEEELESEFKTKRDEFQFIIDERRVHFAEEVARQQRRFKTGLFTYLIRSRPLNVLTAPLIYSGFVPFLLLDVFITVFQTICFPIYGIPKVKRSEYLLFDREDLPYLNLIEKFNCFYCSYGNGLAAYFREIAARTEQYWCPIKHARRIKTAHSRYPNFFEFGDAESYLKGLERIRKEFKEKEPKPLSK